MIWKEAAGTHIIDKAKANSFIKNESQILESLKHKRIPSYITNGNIEVDDVVTEVLIMEYIEGDCYGDELKTLKKRGHKESLEDATKVINQICSALEYMASQDPPLYHRDIKPKNLINHTKRGIVLIDFGLAKEFKKNRGGNQTEYVSTRWYRAPELILRSQTYSESVDIFALGCIMAELYLGRPIFPGISESDQLTRIVTVLGTPSR